MQQETNVAEEYLPNEENDFYSISASKCSKKKIWIQLRSDFYLILLYELKLNKIDKRAFQQKCIIFS